MVRKPSKSSISKRNAEATETDVPPAYMLSISLENVRCFGPRQTLDLSDGKGRPARWTVILGDNGVGKTTVLQTISTLEPVFVRSLGDKRIYPRIYPLFMGSNKWEVWREQEDSSAHVYGKICYGSKISYERKKFETLDVSYIYSRKSLKCDKIGDVAAGLLFFGYGAARRMGTTALSSEEAETGTATLFDDNEKLVNPEEWLLQIDYAASKRSTAQAAAKVRREQVKDILINILPDVDEIRITTPTAVTDKPRVEFKTPYGWIPIRRLGLGYRTMITWTVDLASRLFDRYPDSPDPISEPAVVLVDEIDLHMHPRWQRTIMAYLSERFKNTQFIVTAHSPLIVQSATDANIAVLRREGDHVVVDQSIKAIHGWRIDQVLTSDLFGLESARPSEFDDVLRERKNILTKSRVTKRDRERLAVLNATIDELPVGETLEDAEAMDIVRRAAQRMKKAGD